MDAGLCSDAGQLHQWVGCKWLLFGLFEDVCVCVWWGGRPLAVPSQFCTRPLVGACPGVPHAACGEAGKASLCDCEVSAVDREGRLQAEGSVADAVSALLPRLACHARWWQSMLCVCVSN